MLPGTLLGVMDRFLEWLSGVPLLGPAARCARAVVLKMMGQFGARGFEDQNALEVTYPPNKTFEGRGDVHALWLSGRGVLPHLRPAHVNISRLIIPPRDWPYVDFVEQSLGQDRDYQEEIERMVGRACDLGIKTRRLEHFPSVALTFYCPTSRMRGWVSVQPLFPTSETRTQTTFRIRRLTNRRTCDRLWKSYQRMWQAAVPVNASEPQT